jgi:phage-related protein
VRNARNIGCWQVSRFEQAIYVLHAFQKKSPSGIRSSLKDIDLIKRRLNEARTDFEARYGEDKR